MQSSNESARRAARGYGGVGLGIACLLTALAAAPAWSSPFSMFGFEPDKANLVMLLLFIGLGASLGAAQLIGAPAWRYWALPLIILALGAISCAFSIQPAWSWYGSPHRAQGFVQLAALPAVFWLVALIAKTDFPWRRVTRAIVLSSVPIVLIAVWQSLGWPLPLRWSGDPFSGRLFSTLGNPVFLGSYLTFLLPLTLAECVDAGQGLPRWSPKRAQRALPLVGLLALQLFVLLATRARGAWLGLAGGLLFAALAVSVGRRRRLLALLLGSALLLLLGTAWYLTGYMFHDGATAGPGIVRALDPTGSGRERLRIWSAALDALTGGSTSAGRLLFGSGLEAQGLILPAVLPPKTTLLGQAAPVPLLVDRSHNLLLDLELGTGVLSVLAWGALFVAAVWAGLRRLGIACAAGALLVGVFGSAAAMLALAQGRGALVPLGIGLCICMGLVICALRGGLRREASPDSCAPRPGLPVWALLAGVFGHWIDLQFGFETSAAGLLYALCLASLRCTWRPPEGSPNGYTPPAAGRATPFDELGLLSLQTGAIMIACLYGSEGFSGLGLLSLLGLIWLTSSLLLGAWFGWRQLSAYPVLSLGPALLTWAAFRLCSLLPGFEGAWKTGLAWAGVIACAGWIAGRLWADAGRPFFRRPSLGRLAGIIVGILGTYFVVRLMGGDLLVRQGLNLTQGTQTALAFRTLDAALVWGLHDELTYDAIAQTWLAEARSSPESEALDPTYAQAADAMRRAWSASPREAQYGRRWGLILWEWALKTAEPDERQAHLQEALGILERSAQILPLDTQLKEEIETLRASIADGSAP